MNNLMTSATLFLANTSAGDADAAEILNKTQELVSQATTWIYSILGALLGIGQST